MLTGCASSTPDAVRRCNSPTASLDDPEMWDCYSFDRAANDRMLARKKSEIDARINAVNSQTNAPVAEQNRTPATYCSNSKMESGFVSTRCGP
jgi:hypothetical protein